MVSALGERLRALRLLKNLDQITLAERAGVALSALKRLEGGQGSTVHTLVSVVRALGRSDWLASVAPVPTVNPLTMPRGKPTRVRASARKTSGGADGH